MKRSKERTKLDAVLHASALCIFELNLKNQHIEYVENAEMVFGMSDERLLSEITDKDGLFFAHHFIEKFVHEKDRALAYHFYNEFLKRDAGISASIEARLLRADDYYWCRFSVEPITDDDGKVQSVIFAIANISSYIDRIKELETANKVDSFTELYNKVSALEIINHEIEIANTSSRYAFIILDINDFKGFNDTYGHDVGDLVLKAVADKIRATFGLENAILGRFGGDEFIALIKKYSSIEELKNKLESLTPVIAGKYTISISAGVAIYDKVNNTFAKLFKSADKALYEAKGTNKAVVIDEN